MSSNSSIVKNTLHAGKSFKAVTDGCKVHFHFQTWKLDKERTLLDDSRKIGKFEPMVLVIGRKFKLEVWEDIIKLMSLGEVASFKVKKHLVYSYPFISKTLRDLGKDTPVRHSCTMTLQTEGIGYKDLDELIRNPCDLEFIIELLKVETPDEYEKDLWQLSVEERLSLLPVLREKGNQAYKENRFEEAEEAYSKAIGICEQLLIRERKHDEDWNKIMKIKVPILLNYAQCKLRNDEFYEVIEHCTAILDFEPDNEKALYRRGRAHVGAWNPDQAEEDFKTLKTLNPSLASTVEKELAGIRKLRKEKEDQDKSNLKNMFSKGDS